MKKISNKILLATLIIGILCAIAILITLRVMVG